MLEQELKNQEAAMPTVQTAAAPDSSQPNLFGQYEIKNWNFTPRIYKILAVSAIANILALLVVGQTHLLTQRGCDSPFVSQVCQVLDIVYVGGKMLTTDTAFVDKPYEKTTLGDDVDITYIDSSSETPPLVYPDGYFALANPEEFALRQQMLEQNQIAGIPNSPPFEMPFSGSISTVPSTGDGSDLLKMKQNLPPANRGGIKGGIPTNPFGNFPVPTYPTRRTSRPNTVKTRTSRIKNNPIGNDPSNINNNTVAGQPKPTPTPTPEVKDPTIKGSDPVTDVEINRDPLRDLGKYVNDLVTKKEVNLKAKFIVNAKGKLNKNGEFDQKSFKYIQASSEDPKMVEVIRQSIEAINKSGYLKYLSNLTGKDVNLSLQQDDVNLTGEVSSELDSTSLANVTKGLLDLAIGRVKNKKAGPDASQNDKDDLALLNNATIKVVDKKIVITFAVPKALAQDLIQRKLIDEAKEPTPPNSTAIVKDKNTGEGQ